LTKEAGRSGLRIVAPPDLFLNAASLSTKDWPIDAWHLQDEPDVANTPVPVLESRARRVKEWDPTRPDALVIGQGGAARKYGAIGDILMLDWYPVPHLP